MTSRAAWIVPLKQTIAPNPRAGSEAATRIAFSILGGPSECGSSCRALRTGEHDRLVRLQQQIRKIAGLLHRVRAVRDHYAGDLGTREHSLMRIARPKANSTVMSKLGIVAKFSISSRATSPT